MKWKPNPAGIEELVKLFKEGQSKSNVKQKEIYVVIN
jgi:hypothetical protein